MFIFLISCSAPNNLNKGVNTKISSNQNKSDKYQNSFPEKFEMNTKNLTFKINEDKLIDFKLYDSNDKQLNDLEFISENQNILQNIGSNKFKGISEGLTYIIVFSKKYKEKTFIIPVYVTKKIERNINFIRINPPVLIIKKGDNKKFYSEIYFSDISTPVKDYNNWTVESKNVGDINSEGNFLAINKGETSVFSFFNNDTIYKSQSKVFVKESEKDLIALEDIYIDQITSSYKEIIGNVGFSDKIESKIKFNFGRISHFPYFLSGNESIVKVYQDGSFELIGEGETFIKITNLYDYSKPYFIPVKSIKFDSKIKCINTEKKIINLKLNSDYEISLDNNYDYEIENNQICKLINNKLTGMKTGTTKLILKDKSNSSLKSYIPINVFSDNDPNTFLNKLDVYGKYNSYNVKLNWEKIPGNYEYQVFRNNTLLYKTKENYFEDKNLNGNMFVYKIKVCNDKVCNESNSRTAKRPAPESPRIINAYSKYINENLLNYIEWENLNDSNITYQVYRDNKLIAKVNTNSFQDTFKVNTDKSTYKYNIKSCIDNICSEEEKSYFLNIPSPENTEFISVKKEDNKYILKWKVPLNNMPSTYYKLYKDEVLIYSGIQNSFEYYYDKKGYFTYKLLSCNHFSCSSGTIYKFSSNNLPLETEIYQPKVVRVNNNSYNISLSWKDVLSKSNDTNEYYKLYKNDTLIYQGKLNIFVEDTNTLENYYYVETCNIFGCSKSNVVKSSLL
ncbi:MAG: hypothetical protein KatS3mg068_0437 [Candidatus Sericytochromatia bacterium]|nr:MAG: hypothetical protein KatS3mg068_0437 [Candidatus Sericytochromatia bacterium]